MEYSMQLFILFKLKIETIIWTIVPLHLVFTTLVLTLSIGKGPELSILARSFQTLSNK